MANKKSKKRISHYQREVKVEKKVKKKNHYQR